MSEKINLDVISLKFIFNKNRSYILPVLIILVSIMLFSQFVIPEYNALIKTRKEAEALSLKLKMLKENLNVLTNVNDDVLNSQHATLISVLPKNKDVIKILNSIYVTAQKTGVNLGDFSFKIGNITKPENAENLPVVKLSVPIDADVKAANSFIEAISKTVPLSEVDSVKIGGESTVMTISFYYKPLSPSVYNEESQIFSISQKGLTLIDKFSSAENPSSSLQSVPTSTSSGQESTPILSE